MFVIKEIPACRDVTNRFDQDSKSSELTSGGFQRVKGCMMGVRSDDDDSCGSLKYVGAGIMGSRFQIEVTQDRRRQQSISARFYNFFMPAIVY